MGIVIDRRRGRKCHSPLTLRLEALLHDVVYDLLGVVYGVLPPGLAVVRAKDNNLTFLAAQRGEVRHLHDHRPNELGGARTQLQHATGQGLALHQLRRMHGALRLHIAAGDPRRLAGGARGDDHAHPTVPAATHGPATGIDQEGYQEALPA